MHSLISVLKHTQKDQSPVPGVLTETFACVQKRCPVQALNLIPGKLLQAHDVELLHADCGTAAQDT